MRIIFLSPLWTLALCFIVWPVLQVGAALFCFYLPDRFYHPKSFFYRSHKFEKNGKFYDKVFHVKKWKHLLPDGGAIFTKHGFKKKNLNNFSLETLNKFLVESARGELTHWLAIFPFWVFWLFTPPLVPWIMLIYALLVNMPSIIIQRYNRPRIHRLIEKKQIK